LISVYVELVDSSSDYAVWSHWCRHLSGDGKQHGRQHIHCQLSR